jgi:hypothetical protein
MEPSMDDDDWTPEKGEIERLRWWLQHILNMRDRPAVDLREAANSALLGDAKGPSE